MTVRNLGLPDLPTEAPDTNEKLSKRVEEVRSLLRDVWMAAVAQIGVDETTRLWKDAPNEKKIETRGRKKKTTLSKRDNILLFVYDSLADDPEGKKKLVEFLGWSFHRELSGEQKFASPEAGERHIRRLLKMRRDGKLKPIKTQYKIAEYVLSGDDDGQ